MQKFGIYGYAIEYKPYSDEKWERIKKVYDSLEIANDAINQMTKSNSWPRVFIFRIIDLYVKR